MSTSAPIWEYKMIQVPPGVEVGKRDMETAAARFLESQVNKEAANGWEFYRVDAIGVREAPGCLTPLHKGNPVVEYYVITFRRPAGSPS